MRKKIYAALCQRLNDTVLGVRHISLWNKNVEHLATSEAIATPAVFVEFEPIVWSQLQGRARSADIRVRLHIVTETLTSPASGSPYQAQALEHLDLIEQISATVQGMSGEGFNTFMLVESITDHDHEQIEVNEECFITHITDTSAQRPQAVVTGVILKQTSGTK